MTNNSLTFEQWMAMVDKKVESIIGLSTSDLPDICYRDMYDDGMTPASVAREALRNANE